ncbi:MAG: response regulator [Prochlorococcaceae cyanobacterium]
MSDTTPSSALSGVMVEGIKVAIVDDDLRIRELLALELNDLGCSATVFSSAEALLEDPQSQLFNLVLLDLTMPGLDGFEALKRLRAKGHQGWIVVMSSIWSLGRWQQLIACGAKDYIVKTSLIEQLPELVAALKPFAGKAQQLKSA